MAEALTRFDADEGVSRASFNRRIDQANKAISEAAQAANNAAASAAKAQETADEVKEGMVNKNLLHNWYFKKPVNSKGLTEYRGTNDTFIDRWYSYPKNLILNLTEKGIAATLNDPTAGLYNSIRYIFDATEYAGKTLTFSLLTNSRTKINVAAFKDRSCTGCAGSKAITLTGETDLLSFSFVVPEDSTEMPILIYPMSTSEEYADSTTLIAAKLELGSVQTLAQKDESGEWVLTEIPDFAEQAAICSQYGETTYNANLITEEYIGAAKPFAIVQSYTASVALTAGNMGNFLSMKSTSDLTVTIPLDTTADLPIGAEVEVCRMGTGAVTFVPETVETTTEVDGESVITTEAVTLNSVDGALSISAQYGCAALKKIAADCWLISGSLE